MKKIIIGFSLIAVILLSSAAFPLLGLLEGSEQPKNNGVFCYLQSLEHLVLVAYGCGWF